MKKLLLVIVVVLTSLYSCLKNSNNNKEVDTKKGVKNAKKIEIIKKHNPYKDFFKLVESNSVDLVRIDSLGKRIEDGSPIHYYKVHNKAILRKFLGGRKGVFSHKNVEFYIEEWRFRNEDMLLNKERLLRTYDNTVPSPIIKTPNYLFVRDSTLYIAYVKSEYYRPTLKYLVKKLGNITGGNGTD